MQMANFSSCKIAANMPSVDVDSFDAVLFNYLNASDTHFFNTEIVVSVDTIYGNSYSSGFRLANSLLQDFYLTDFSVETEFYSSHGGSANTTGSFYGSVLTEVSPVSV